MVLVDLHTTAMKFHKDGTLPQNGEVFVFGSNLAGIHGAGAAKAAVEQFGAIYGVGIGLNGNSYAIPTKDYAIKTMTLGDIEPFIKQFLKYADACSDVSFFVTRIGCGLASYKDSDIAPMFKYAKNCSFAEEWKPFLED